MISKRSFLILCAIVFALWLLVLWLSSFRQEVPYPGTRASISDSLIAKVTKLIIRQAINYVDFKKTKNKVIERIKRKSKRSFRREMDRIFDDVEFMGLTDTFGITHFSSREKVITTIESIDKDMLFKKLDEIPDRAVARLIKKKLREQQLNSIAQLKDFLYEKIDRIMREVSG